MSDINGRGVLPKAEEKNTSGGPSIEIRQGNELLVIIQILATINRQLKDLKDLLAMSIKKDVQAETKVEELTAEEPK